MGSAGVPHVLDVERLPVHLPQLLRCARSLCRSADAAEDLVQDTIERVLRAPRTVVGDELGYLLRTLRNTHVDRVRAAARRVTTTSLPERLEPADRRAEAGLDAGAEARSVLAAVSALPEPYRDAVVTIDLCGYSYDEAARVLRVPTGTVQSRAFRGRDRVARAMRGTGDRAAHDQPATRREQGGRARRPAPA
jgi:RNA polymerase sigma-70 factor (ECF subfamily)